jgi:hypothetical protein
MFDIRFHLGAGQHYKHWQVKSASGVVYYDPKEYSLVMSDCVLKNNRNKAEKIFESKRRDVCGFVRCYNYRIIDLCQSDYMFLEPGVKFELMFDPKIAPYWRKHNDPNAYDGMTYSTLVTNGRRVFVLSV